MIFGHHMGEDMLPALIASGAAAGPIFLLAIRTRLGRMGGALRRATGRK